MLAHARASYPEECCGVMLGAGEEVRLALPMENTAESRRTRYEIRPEDLLEATREARERGLGLVGVYHSHPDRDAYFSETDLKNCCPWYLYLVLSIKDGAFDHAACWRPDGDRAIICPCAFERL
jgi:proteasome lid subunit RPN8/RPN11